MRTPRLASIVDGFRLRKSYAGGDIGVTADTTRKLDEAPTHPKAWSAPFRASAEQPNRLDAFVDHSYTLKGR